MKLTDDSECGGGQSVTLIGTPLSLPQLRRWLAVLEPQVEVAEELTLNPVLELDSVSIERAVAARRRVLLSLPMSCLDAVKSLGEMLSHRRVSWVFVPMASDIWAGRVVASDALLAMAPRQARRSMVLTSGYQGAGMCSLPGVSVLPGGAGQLPGAGGLPGGVDPAALIGRAVRPVDETLLQSYLSDRVVLVTGAGGSIGSELCRVIARQTPARLVLVERSENALFEIDREMRSRFPRLPIDTRLHDVTHGGATLELFEQARPDVVLHAAAHKHVPMMEHHPAEAVENNVYGTRWVVDAAEAAGASRLVMISTDKAVHPSSVMGATKRLAERYVQHVNARSRMTGCMVRFGNVLGSACSVLPIWSRQAAEGGPITVTHPGMTRYFMTIPEAAGLVLASGGLAAGGEVFVLDMGEPIAIVEMARRFCQAQGLEPGLDIEIVFTGVRPGEKLHEQLVYGNEDLQPTQHPGIRCRRRTGDAADLSGGEIAQVLAGFDALRGGAGAQRPWSGVTAQQVVAMLQLHVPEMLRRAA